MSAVAPERSRPGPGRGISAAEALVGAAIVLGHNVWRVLPNEVPILFVLALVSARLRDGGFSSLGFRRVESWGLVLGLAVGAAALRIALGAFAIDPLTAQVLPPQHAPAGSGGIAHNPMKALEWIGIAWTFAAIGEEVGYRGYLTARAAEALGGSKAAWWAATVVVSVLFGMGHWYKGLAGVIDSTVAGLILGTVYLLSGRRIVTSMIAHGLIDTTGVVLVFFGLAD
jgi:membrane protease YdiL (CAAX protease family)